jgi:hypothetical protein
VFANVQFHVQGTGAQTGRGQIYIEVSPWGPVNSRRGGREATIGRRAARGGRGSYQLQGDSSVDKYGAHANAPLDGSANKLEKDVGPAEGEAQGGSGFNKAYIKNKDLLVIKYKLIQDTKYMKESILSYKSVFP